MLILVPWRAPEPFRRLLRRDPCSLCGASSSGTLDHIIPRSVDGPNALENLTAACPDCQQAKADRPLLTFLLGSVDPRHPLD